MSDDLMRRLRDHAFGTETTERNLMNSAADRIEELEAELEYWKKDSADAWDKCEENRLKLAKAVGALEKIQHNKYGISAARARTTLAELKGQDDE